MLSGLIVALVIGTAAVPSLDLQKVEVHIQAEKWSQAEKALRREMRGAINQGGALDGGHLVDAVRYRAIIEAGQGRLDMAAWWWHAGLNLQSHGADEVLETLPEEIAGLLRPIKVRVSRPPAPVDLPKLKKHQQPQAVQSRLFTLANQRMKGYVKFEVEVGERGEPLKPLLLEASIPTAGVYAALEKLTGTRFPAIWVPKLGPTHNISFRLTGR